MDWKIELQKKLEDLVGDESARSFARKCDVTDTTIRKYLRGEGNPTLESILKIALACGVKPSYLLPSWYNDEDSSTKGVVSEFTSIPKYKAKLAGGHGSFETSDQIEANLSFRTEFIRRKGNPKDMALFEIIGDSMKPFIYEGDVVLVDMSKNTLEDIVDGKAYAFREDHTVKVKRLSRQGNRLIATSENVMKYPPYEIIVQEFFLIGKVVWVGHEVT